jgi:phage recombination protein Bet
MTQTVDEAVTEAAESRALAKRPANIDGVLALTADQTWWVPKQLAALKALGIKNADNADLLLFFHYCQRTRLDPFSKQIYLLERRNWNKKTKQWEYNQVIQVGIDGFRINAQRAADKQGVFIEYEDTLWIDADEKPHKYWLSAEPPAAAIVTVVKVLPDGRKLRVPGFARFDSYAAYGKNNDTGERYLQAQWAVMGEHMIEKCAEAFALRRAFPNDLSGLFIEEELQGRQGPVDLSSPPRGETYTRDPEATDDGTVTGTVVDEAAGGTESNEEAPPPDPKVSAAKIAAVFREYRLGARDQAQLRVAIVTGIWAAAFHANDPITAYVAVEQLEPSVMAELADHVAVFCDALKPTPEAAVKDQLIAYGAAVMETIHANRERTPDGPAAE